MFYDLNLQRIQNRKKTCSQNYSACSAAIIEPSYAQAVIQELESHDINVQIIELLPVECYESHTRPSLRNDRCNSKYCLDSQIQPELNVVSYSMSGENTFNKFRNTAFSNKGTFKHEEPYEHKKIHDNSLSEKINQILHNLRNTNCYKTKCTSDNCKEKENIKPVKDDKIDLRDTGIQNDLGISIATSPDASLLNISTGHSHTISTQTVNDISSNNSLSKNEVHSIPINDSNNKETEVLRDLTNDESVYNRFHDMETAIVSEPQRKDNSNNSDKGVHFELPSKNVNKSHVEHQQLSTRVDEELQVELSGRDSSCNCMWKKLSDQTSHRSPRLMNRILKLLKKILTEIEKFNHQEREVVRQGSLEHSLFQTGRDEDRSSHVVRASGRRAATTGLITPEFIRTVQDVINQSHTLQNRLEVINDIMRNATQASSEAHRGSVTLNAIPQHQYTTDRHTTIMDNAEKSHVKNDFRPVASSTRDASGFEHSGMPVITDSFTDNETTNNINRHWVPLMSSDDAEPSEQGQNSRKYGTDTHLISLETTDDNEILNNTRMLNESSTGDLSKSWIPLPSSGNVESSNKKVKGNTSETNLQFLSLQSRVDTDASDEARHLNYSGTNNNDLLNLQSPENASSLLIDSNPEFLDNTLPQNYEQPLKSHRPELSTSVKTKIKIEEMDGGNNKSSSVHREHEPLDLPVYSNNQLHNYEDSTTYKSLPLLKKKQIRGSTRIKESPSIVESEVSVCTENTCPQSREVCYKSRLPVPKLSKLSSHFMGNNSTEKKENGRSLHERKNKVDELSFIQKPEEAKKISIVLPGSVSRKNKSASDNKDDTNKSKKTSKNAFPRYE